MEVGGWQVRTVVDGTFALDGGSMFGVVPRALWARTNPPDDRNRIPLASRLLLLRGHGRVVLVDTGLGDHWSDKERDIFAIRARDGGIVDALGRAGLEPEDVTDVILTHLHFDHAAGTTQGAGGQKLTFPAAEHHLQRRHWEWACSPTLKDRASFRPRDFAVLGESRRLRLHDGPTSILPGVDLVPLDGHTRAMQAVVVRGADADDDRGLVYAADLVPTASHVRLPFIMAYDNEPLRTLEEKRDLLSRVAERGWTLVLEHDPAIAAVRLENVSGTPEILERLEQL